jgi:hypothetical protein
MFNTGFIKIMIKGYVCYYTYMLSWMGWENNRCFRVRIRRENVLKAGAENEPE